MLKPEDLLPGDLIITYKKPKDRQLLQRFFDWTLKRYSYSIYGEECLLPYKTHSRTAIGKLGEHAHCFDWTDPAAKYARVEDWMLLPDYAHIFRPRGVLLPTPEMMFNYFEQFNGTLYDFLDLGGMALGITRLFHGLGKKNFVCSTGARKAQEDMIFHRNIDVNLDLAKTPPCFPAQYPMLYEHIPYTA